MVTIEKRFEELINAEWFQKDEEALEAARNEAQKMLENLSQYLPILKIIREKRI